MTQHNQSELDELQATIKLGIYIKFSQLSGGEPDNQMQAFIDEINDMITKLFDTVDLKEQPNDQPE